MYVGPPGDSARSAVNKGIVVSRIFKVNVQYYY